MPINANAAANNSGNIFQKAWDWYIGNNYLGNGHDYKGHKKATAYSGLAAVVAAVNPLSLIPAAGLIALGSIGVGVYNGIRAYKDYRAQGYTPGDAFKHTGQWFMGKNYRGARKNFRKHRDLAIGTGIVALLTRVSPLFIPYGPLIGIGSALVCVYNAARAYKDSHTGR